jgi:2-polyprenyl-6-methoxyphenol hydroxylase-like FAD-dependent oxidoreductase
MRKLRILIVGAGIAGGAAAAFLGRDGHDVTVVERSARARSSGSPVDVRGAGLEAVRVLGVEDALRAHDTGVRTLELVDRVGRRITTIGMRTSPDDIEIARVDLAKVLVEKARDAATFRFDDTFASLAPDDAGVGVRFLSGREERFDLIVGADGQHSATRRALWDRDSDATAIGLAIATVPLPVEIDDPSVVTMHNEPAVSLTVHPAGGHPGAAFIFRSEEAPVGRADQIALIRRMYASTGWRAAEFLSALDTAEDMYFDAVRRVRTSSWSHGRVALLGDAASSLTILGNGSSTALAGAHLLGRALAESADIPSALGRYEDEVRPLVAQAQRGAGVAAGFLVPRTRAGLGIRNLAARMMRTV